MSALVVTILIGVSWAAMTALGYLRGGWREVVTLAAMLLSYAMLSEWAAPNGRDFAGLFGGDLYRSSTAVAFLYLLGGTLLLGYFGGSRLPRPVPLSTTERFAGGGIGFFNGALFVALALRTLQAYTFAPGDNAVLAGTPLAGALIGNIGYGIALAMLAGAVAPFLSYVLLRGLRPAAEAVEDPSRVRPPHAPDESPVALGPPRPAATPAVTPPAVPLTVPAPSAAASGTTQRAAPPGAVPSPSRRDAPASLVPTHPVLPPAVPAPMLPTPVLPPARPQRGTPAREAISTSTTPLDLPAPNPANAAPAASIPDLPRVAPPGLTVAAALPVPTVPAGESVPPSGMPSPPASVGDASTTTASPMPGAEPAFAPQQMLPPSPPPSRAMPEPHSATPLTETEGVPLVLPAAATAPDDPAAGEVEVGTAPENAPPPPVARAEPLPHVPLPRTGTVSAPEAAAGAPRPSRARIANVRQPSPPPPSSRPLPLGVPGSARPPVQPGPRMHPCPVCAYSVRDEARYCPNCGGVQPVPAKTGG